MDKISICSFIEDRYDESFLMIVITIFSFSVMLLIYSLFFVESSFFFLNIILKGVSLMIGIVSLFEFFIWLKIRLFYKKQELINIFSNLRFHPDKDLETLIFCAGQKARFWSGNKLVKKWQKYQKNYDIYIKPYR